MTYLATTLRQHPELAVFLTLALGFAIGRVSIGSFSLGNVVGTLLAGVVIGQLGIDVPAAVKIVFFDLFLFATGYKVGPQFVRGLGRSALPQVALAVVLSVSSLLMTWLVARTFGYDAGTAAGLMAGAFTESTIIGTASDAIGRLGRPAAETARLLHNVPTAYAVTYLVGTTLSVWFLSHLAPRLLRVDLRAESRKLETELSGGASQSEATRSAYREWAIRAYRLADNWHGRSVAEVEGAFPGERVFVRRLRRGDALLDAAPATLLRSGDVVALAARRRVVTHGVAIGVEVEDRALLDFPLDAFDVVLTSRAAANRTIESVAEEHGRGVVLARLVRGGEQIPFGPSTTLHRGDVLRLAGAVDDVERAGRALGYVDRPSSATDVVFLGLGIFLGGLVGLLAVDVRGVPLSLTASGGALVMGLVFGWLRSVRPTFGRIPEAALWVFDSLGLAVFIAVVGIAAGPDFVASLRRTGVALPLIAVVLALVPQLVALLFGRFVLKLAPVTLLGACAGAVTSTAALRAVQDAADSKLPVLGYTVPYAVGNLLLTAWGPVIVLLTR